MNLAFQALLILAMLLPGIIFRSAFNRGFWNFPMGRLGPASEQIPKALIHALWINSTWALMVHGMHEIAPRWIWAIDFRAAACWVSNDFGRDQLEFAHALSALVVSPVRIAAYFGGLYGLSWLLGARGHQCVRKHKLDRKYMIFRFDHEWHYLFRAEVLDFPDPNYNRASGMTRPRISAEEREATVVAAVVDFKETSYLYLGLVVDYFFDDEGNLDRLLLDGAKRRKLLDDEVGLSEGSSYLERDRFHDIKGHYFVLRMSEIRTLNIDYLTREDFEQVDDEAAKLASAWIPDRQPSG